MLQTPVVIRLKEWLPASTNVRDLDESPLVRLLIILSISLWWLGVALFDFSLLGVLIAVYAFFLTFCAMLFVFATFQILRDKGAFVRLRELAHTYSIF